ncbi:META domain-containing protein [Sphingomonas sp. MA1305]|uniref:META domain-containing protein n=1 Tax=Sphingomonas sp. MA1305 TaxID=2479204 RepID=UPI0018DFC167|nr:META domain-containing protein [Sphingomonas sp. MA1305]MBI0476721.1 META domain-containing protein [Sphingomonas sp. MA1305]
MPPLHHRIVVVALAASAQPTESRGGPATTRWMLSEIDGRPVATGRFDAAHLVFGPDRQIGGSAGCSSFGGNRIRWSTDRTGTRGTLTVDPKGSMFWTTIRCDDSPADRDGTLFWDKMRRPRSWAASAGRLTITFADGSTARLVPRSPR